jgi:hypothetical protein
MWLLESRPIAERGIVLVSDLAAHGFKESWPKLGAPVEVIDVAEGAVLENRAISRLEVEHLAQNGSEQILVEVANFSAHPVHDLPITLRLDGKPVARGLLDLEAFGHAQKRFSYTAAAAGASAAADDGARLFEAELPEDNFHLDDRRGVVDSIPRTERLLLVDGDPRTTRREAESFYLSSALNVEQKNASHTAISVIPPEELPQARLDNFDAIFLCNVPATDSFAALVNRVKGGGGLFIALGDRVDVDAYNRLLGPLLPAPLEGFRTVGNTSAADETSAPGEALGRIELGHPIFSSMGPEARAITEARLGRYGLVRPRMKGGERPLIEMANGAPLLMEKRVGQGRVLLLLTTIDRDWGDLPIQPLFVPLVIEAANYLTGELTSGHARREALPPPVVGERYALPLPDGAIAVKVTTPSGKEYRVAAKPPPERGKVDVPGRTARWPIGVLEEPGRYRVTPVDAWSANRAAFDFWAAVDAEESDFRRVDAARLAALNHPPKEAPAKGRTSPLAKVPLWHALGAALLLLLALESAASLRR